MRNTKIEWATDTWNPTTGCTKVSPGCDHCYAEVMHERFNGKGSFATVKMHSQRLAIPFHWRRPRRVFVNSMSDLFHQDITDFFIAEVFAVMTLTPRHTYQILTKRHARMRSLLSTDAFRGLVDKALRARGKDPLDGTGPVVLPNVWLGISVEDQQWADIRIPALLETPAAVRFLSCEPLLGPVNLDPWRNPGELVKPGTPADTRLDWVIVGGESGRGARPMHPDWARSLRDQCQAAGVAFHFKQHGEWAPANDESSDDEVRRYRAICLELDGTVVPFDQEPADGPSVTMLRLGKHTSGRELDGREWNEYPELAL